MATRIGGWHGGKSGSGGSPWMSAVALLAALSFAMLGLFRHDVADMVSVWWKSSTYNHCLLLPAILAWLVAQRMNRLRQLEPEPWPAALLWLALGMLLWFLGMLASVSLFRHAALVVMAQGLVMALLGRAVARALLFPLVYALFLIPVGSELEPTLQIATARMAIGLLWAAGVPAHIDGIFITIPNGYFRVAEACSGTGFLIAMAAYAALAANLCFTSMRRRIGFIVFALVTCLLANGVRAFGIIYFAWHNGIASAVVADHIVYGWFFFAAVIGLVMWIARRWFDRTPQEAWFEPGSLQGFVERPRVRATLLAVLALAIMAAPLGWLQVQRGMSAPLPTETTLPHVPGWRLGGDEARYPWRPHFTGADRMVVGHYFDSVGRAVDLALVLYTHQEDGRELVGFGQGAAGPDGTGLWTWSAPASAPRGGKGEILAGPGASHRRAATFYVVDGAVLGSPGKVKLATLKARLWGDDQRAMALVLTTPQDDGAAAAAMSARTLADFLTALGPVKSVADRSLAIE